MEPCASERRRTPCAEFPNDNPDLHHGATWISLELGSEPTCELPRIGLPVASMDEAPRATTEVDTDLLDDEEEPIEIVDELCFDDALDDLPPDPEAPEATSERSGVDPFARLVAALGDVALLLGAGEEGIACLEALFGQARYDERSNPGERALQALVAGNVIVEGAKGFARSSQFTAKVVAWQGILRGESEDFALPDGGALEPLDEWAADLLARIVGPPARGDGIRRELRRRGVAAFGLVAEAA